MDIYEISILNQVSFEQVALIVSKFRNIPIQKIGTQEAYFNQLFTTDALEIGISIQYQSKGYKSFVELTLTHEMTESEFVQMVCQFAKILNTDVTIGDVTSKNEFSMGEYLVIGSDQKYQRAYEERNDAEMFDVKTYTEKSDVSELFKINK